MAHRRNTNRGYQQLTVWQDARELYVQTCRSFSGWPYELRRVSSGQIASVDSVHRNIAEGYCRRSIKEYLQFLGIALGSLGESVSGLHVYQSAGQLPADEFEGLDRLAFKLENGLKKLIESLERKKATGDWQDSFIVRESNAAYGNQSLEEMNESEGNHHFMIPTIHSSEPITNPQ